MGQIVYLEYRASEGGLLDQLHSSRSDREFLHTKYRKKEREKGSKEGKR